MSSVENTVLAIFLQGYYNTEILHLLVLLPIVRHTHDSLTKWVRDHFVYGDLTAREVSENWGEGRVYELGDEHT